MFFRRRGCHPLIKLVLILFGVKWMKAKSADESTKREWRAKRKLFRQKMREAFAVWDDDEQDDSENVTATDKGVSM